MEPMNRVVLPYLIAHYWESRRRQSDREPVTPRDGRVRVYEHWPERLFGGQRAASFFLVWTPGPRDASGQLVPCTAEACRRWVDAALAYATAVDGVSAELPDVRRRAMAVPRWRPRLARRALREWEAALQRYEQVLREAAEAYEPVGAEIRLALRTERERAAERAREEARRAAEAYARRAALAERAVWGWRWATGDDGATRTAHIFRHDVAGADGSAAPPLDLATLRQELKAQGPVGLVWDEAAVAATERELEEVDFGSWWREVFHEDHRTFTAPPAPRATPRGNPSGGTATGGTGGFTGGHGGGFSCGGFGGY
ncbi:hypothetical protein [Streptomyces sp. NPDC048623]|uniref:hypothetical protein n=1 Tax=Streptomyces sp. NPDC048623 TaxID=3155761 RepID=UPI00342A65A8